MPSSRRMPRASSASASRPIRVLFIVDQMGVGGTELNAVRTAEHLDSGRVTVEVLALSDPPGVLATRYAAAGINVRTLPLRSLIGVHAAQQAMRLGALLRVLRPDVVHAHDIYSNAFAVPIARLAGVPFVMASRRWSHLLLARRHRVLNRFGYRWAHRVLANSAAVGASLAADEGVRAARIEIVPNFLEPTAFAPAPLHAVARVRAAAGVPAGSRVVGITARLSAEKDHATAIRAFAAAASRHPDWHLLLVGDGPERPVLTGAVEEAGLAGRVHFSGVVREPWNLHGLFDLTVLPSLSEGFPNSVLEGMAQGNAVLATNVGGVPDALTDGVEGLLVPSGDASTMAAALSRLLGDVDLRTRLGAAGRRRASEEFGADRVLARLIGIYERGVDRRRRGH